MRKPKARLSSVAACGVSILSAIHRGNVRDKGKHAWGRDDSDHALSDAAIREAVERVSRGATH
jgi:hypothetical protein